MLFDKTDVYWPGDFPMFYYFLKLNFLEFSNTVKPVLRGHPREEQILAKTGDPLIQVHLHCILVQRTKKCGCLRQVIP